MPRWWATEIDSGKNFPNIEAQTITLCVSNVIETELPLRQSLLPSYVLAWFAFALIFVAVCQPAMAQTTSPKRDINAVLAGHDKELLALPDVIGVYIGTLEDNRTPCLKVMLLRENRATARKIPRSIESYPVRVEVSGKIRPMSQPAE